MSEHLQLFSAQNSFAPRHYLCWSQKEVSLKCIGKGQLIYIIGKLFAFSLVKEGKQIYTNKQVNYKQLDGMPEFVGPETLAGARAPYSQVEHQETVPIKPLISYYFYTINCR